MTDSTKSGKNTPQIAGIRRRTKNAGARSGPQPKRRGFLGTLRGKVIAGIVAFAAALSPAFATNFANTMWSKLLGGSTAAAPQATPTHPASRAAAPPAVPFTVAASVNYHDCGAFALPTALALGPNYATLVNEGGFTDAQWADFLGPLSGSPVGSVDIALTFAGIPGASTRITDVEVKPVRPPGRVDSGTYIPVPHQGGGDVSYNFSVDLDHPNATLQGQNGQTDFPGFEIDVSPTVSSTVNVVFYAKLHDYAWAFVVDYDENGVIKTLNVTRPDGKPFELTGDSSWYSEVFRYDGAGYQPTSWHTPGA